MHYTRQLENKEKLYIEIYKDGKYLSGEFLIKYRDLINEFMDKEIDSNFTIVSVVKTSYVYSTL